MVVEKVTAQKFAQSPCPWFNAIKLEEMKVRKLYAVISQ
jgi:hypothetical protein